MVVAQGIPPEAVGALIGVGIFYVALLVAVAWAYVSIVRRAGYTGWWVLIGLVPLANIVMFFVFAFKQWPVQRELAALRAMAAHQGYAIHPDGIDGVGPGAPGSTAAPAVTPAPDTGTAQGYTSAEQGYGTPPWGPGPGGTPR